MLEDLFCRDTRHTTMFQPTQEVTTKGRSARHGVSRVTGALTILVLLLYSNEPEPL